MRHVGAMDAVMFLVYEEGVSMKRWIVAMNTLTQGNTVALAENGLAMVFSSRNEAESAINEAGAGAELGLFPLLVYVEQDGTMFDESGELVYNPYSEDISDAVYASGSLEELAEILNSAKEDALKSIDMCSLPTFGGEEPASTDGVRSWDKDRLLVGECRPFRIVSR